MEKECLVYTRREAAGLLGMSLVTLDKLIREGRLRIIRVGMRKILIPREAVEAFLEDRRA